MAYQHIRDVYDGVRHAGTPYEGTIHVVFVYGGTVHTASIHGGTVHIAFIYAEKILLWACVGANMAYGGRICQGMGIDSIYGKCFFVDEVSSIAGRRYVVSSLCAPS